MLRALTARRTGVGILLECVNLGASLEDQQMTEKEPPDLNSLDAKLRAARERNQGPGEASEPAQGPAGLGYGSRLSVEIIASLLAGLGLGWVIDHFAGTSPVFLLILMFVGLGIGVYNVIRMSNRMQQAEEDNEH
jgi:ATP synthase protein I